MTESLHIPPGKAFRVAEWQVDPQTGRMSSQETETKLEPKVMEVLVCLAQRAGQVMSREQLEAEVWPGIVVGYDSLASTIIKLRKAFGDSSRQPRIIETVPKKGYRLIAEVDLLEETPELTPLPVKKVRIENAARPETTASPFMTRRFSGTTGNWPAAIRRHLAVLAISVVVLGATTVLWWVMGTRDVEGDNAADLSGLQPSLAVLPFKNISDDPGQEYFSDGMTADLITDLSKLSGLSVIARNSVFAYKNTNVDIRKLGSELGAQYIVEGSVRKVGDSVRITARLIDAGSGFNLWAERFDGQLSNVFELQDEVTNKIVTALEIRLTENERLQLAHAYTNSIEAYDQFLQGWQHFWNMTRENNLAAREHYKNAIDLDPAFARAYANLALTHAYDYNNGWSEEPEESILKAKLYAEKALQLDDQLPQIHWVTGLIATFDKNYEAAMDAARRSIELDPNFADGYGLLAMVLNYGAKADDALSVMDKAMQLNPRHPFIYKVIRGEILFNLREYDQAISDLNLALERNPVAEEPRLWLAAAYAYKNRLDDARWELEQINTADDLSIEYFEKVIPLKDPTQRKHLIDGLYKASLGR